MSTIYRKYRAQNFEEVVGQSQIVNILRKAVAEDRFSHAYLFTGPRGTGKTSMARILSKALNCQVPDAGNPCDKCSNCMSINQNRFLDLIEIDAASNRGIDEIRNLKEGIGFMPSEGKRKIYIIDEVHMLTEPAFNALLKTLEEPPAQVVFILATTEPQKLPLTIISRTQRFDFKLADNQSLKIKLNRIVEAEGFVFDEQAIELVARAGQGSFRDAETILEKVLAGVVKKDIASVNIKMVQEILGYVNSEVNQKFLDSLLDKNLEGALGVVSQVYSSGMNIQNFIKETIELSRSTLLNSLNSNKLKIREIFQVIKELNQASLDMKTALISVLPLEIAVLNICDLNVEESVSKTVVKSVVANPEERVIKKVSTLASVEKLVEKTTSVSTAVKPEAALEKEVNLKYSAPEESLQQIKNNWTAILSDARKHNHFLTAILSGGVFTINESDGGLELRVKSSFHKKQIENPETKRVLNKIINSICGINVDFSCIIDKNAVKTTDTKQSNADLVESILF